MGIRMRLCVGWGLDLTDRDKIRKIAKELGREEELDASLKEQRAVRARINGAKNTRSDRLCL